MTDFEYTSSEETLFDELTETNSASEARDIIFGARLGKLGGKAVSQLNIAPEAPRKPHYSRRGGRSFAEPSDSELDPHWNVQGAPELAFTDEAARLAFLQLAEQSQAAAVQSYADRNGVNLVIASAHIKAKKEIRQR